MLEKQQLKQFFEAEDIVSTAKVLEEYAHDISFVNKVRPELVVKPHNLDQVSKIVEMANAAKTPLIPVSSGSPHFRGDTVPTVGESVIVDLSGMKKILRVDRYNRVCMFEVGVNFGDLIAAVTKEGLRLNVPLMPRSTKSVSASLLEREPVILPKYHWDIGDPLCDVEIVFGSGRLFRTGAAAGPGTLEEQWAAGGAQLEAAGPSSNSWYRIIQASQGTLGIVTWTSARCEVLPDAEEAYLVGSNDLSKIMELVHWLVRLRIANECLVVNGNNLASMMNLKKEDIAKSKVNLPKWVLLYNIAGQEYFVEQRVKGLVEDTRDLCQKIGDLSPAAVLGGLAAADVLTAVRNPSSEPYWKLREKGSSQDVFCLTNFQGVQRLIETMKDICGKSNYAEQDLGIYIQPLVQGVNYHVEFRLPYDPANRKEADQVKAMAEAATLALMGQGGFFSRPYGENTALIMNRDAVTVGAFKKIKQIVDPNQIMNPGKLCF